MTKKIKQKKTTEQALQTKEKRRECVDCEISIVKQNGKNGLQGENLLCNRLTTINADSAGKMRSDLIVKNAVIMLKG